MSENHRNSDWQVIGAVALIALGVVLFMDRIDMPWWGLVRQAFHFAFDVAWPIAVIGLGVLLLITARRGGIGSFELHGKRLYRSRSDRMVGGVLGGFGRYIGVDPTWVRIVYAVLAVFSGFWFAVMVYVIAMIIIPEEPKVAASNVEWPGSGRQPSWTQQPQGSTETVQAPPTVPPAPPQD